MAAILKAENITIVRQEGDTSEIVFIVPEIVPLTGATAHLQVRQKNGDAVLEPTTSITGQTITIALVPNDTKGKAGTHNWELEIRAGEVITTIASGTFEIKKELVV